MATTSAEKDLQKQKASDKANKQSQQRHNELDKLLAEAVAEKKALSRDLKKRETEVERMRTDAKLTAVEQKSYAKDAAKLERTLKSLEKEKRASAKLQQQADALQKQLTDQSFTEQDYLSQIEHLELMLASNRKDASQNMMSRIKELESMLAAERRKASELQPISIVESIGGSSIQPKKSANSTTVKRKRKKAS